MRWIGMPSLRGRRRRHHHHRRRRHEIIGEQGEGNLLNGLNRTDNVKIIYDLDYRPSLMPDAVPSQRAIYTKEQW